MIKIFISLLLLLFTINSYSMDYEYVEYYGDTDLPKRVKMSGEILQGDYQKLISFLRDNKSQDSYFGFQQIELDSRGGNIKEAMKIAQFIKNAYPNIWVKKTCASSCLLLWLSGSSRYVEDNGKLGIHRPTFPKKYYESASLDETKRNYDSLSSEFKNFLLEQGLPLSIYEKLMATDSDNVLWLQKKDIELIGVSSPYLDETKRKLCNAKLQKYLETNTDRDMHSVGSCLQEITKIERIKFFDNLYGLKNTEWAKVKKIILEDD